MSGNLKIKSKAFTAFKKLKLLWRVNPKEQKSSVLGLIVVKISLLKNSQHGVKSKASKDNSLLHIHPQKNRVVESKTRNILGLVRSMLRDKSLPLEF